MIALIQPRDQLSISGKLFMRDEAGWEAGAPLIRISKRRRGSR